MITPEQSTRIVGSYAPTPARFSLTYLLLGLGATFVGIGLIWLVAANLDQLSPLLRFALVVVCWLGATFGSHLLATRLGQSNPVVAAARLVAALLIGAVIFQAAQSLQVAAYEPKLVGLWAVGALALAYATRSLWPLIVGVGAGAVWFVWQTTWETTEVTSIVLALGAAGLLAVSLGVLHGQWEPRFADLWREVGAAFVLVTMFFAALPFVEPESFDPHWSLLLGVALAGLALTAALWRGQGWERFEPLIALAVAVVSLGLVRWVTDTDLEHVNAGDWAHVIIAVVLYVALAVAVAVAGILHDSWRLTLLATGALVIFTTFQSFAVFGQIITGAWLFLLLGAVLVGTGWGFDRARRRLAATLDEEVVR